MNLRSTRNAAPIILKVGAIIYFASMFSYAASAQNIDANQVSRLLGRGDLPGAAKLVEDSNPTRADHVFFQGQLRKAVGQLPAAIAAFREVLRIDPRYVNARRELAHTLLLARDFSVSEFHFRSLLREDQNPNMRQGYRQFLNVIHRNKPIGFNGFLNVLPSSNVNGGTDNTVFDTNIGEFVVDPNSRAESGVGIQAGLSGFVRHVISQDQRLSVDWNVTGTRYNEKRYNQATGNLSLTYEKLTEWGSWSVSPFARRHLREDSGDYQAFGARSNAAWKVNSDDRLQLGLSYENRIYDTQSYQNGSYSNFDARWTHQVNPTLSTYVAFGVGQGNPDASHLRYNSEKLLVGLNQSWNGGWHAGLGAEVGRRDYEANFPLTSFPRSDQYSRVSISVQNTSFTIGGFLPYLTCSSLKNRSNVALYDYRTNECQIRLSRNF